MKWLERTQLREMIQKAPKVGRYKRSQVLKEAAAVMRNNGQELARIEALTANRLYKNVIQEVAECSRIFEYFSGLSLDGIAFEKKEGLACWTKREPIGLCALITSFNYPLLLATYKLAPALFCGNSIILKPSAKAFESSVRFVELLNSKTSLKSFPNSVQVAVCKDQDVAELVESSLVKKVSFTGSSNVARNLVRIGGWKVSTVEGGGKNLAVVMNDCNVNDTVDSVIDGAFTNAGQNCCALSTLFVQEDIYEPFKDRLLEKVQKLQLGHPIDLHADVGPIISNTQAVRIVEKVENAVKEGIVRNLTGGTKFESKNLSFVVPTVLENVVDDHQLMREELFGPVLCLSKFRSLDALLQSLEAKHNSFEDLHLATGIFTNSLQSRNEFVAWAKEGIIWVNTWNAVAPWMPFGGNYGSGMGRELGQGSLLDYSRQTTIIEK